MHSCNNTVAPGVTVHVQTVILQQQHTLAVVFATPSLRLRYALIKTFPLVHDALAKFFNICNFLLVVDTLLHDSPYRIVDGVKIRTFGRPHTWLDEIRRDFFQQLDRLASSVSWRSILLEWNNCRILSDFRQHWQRIYNVYQYTRRKQLLTVENCCLNS